jgi:hypothetical protein
MADDDNIIRLPHAELEKLHALLGRKQLGQYALVNRGPVKLETLKAWMEEMTRRDRIAAETGVDPWRVDETEIGAVRISTVFLGLDHNYTRRGPPILFETMIFGGRLDHFQNRCATWAEAEAMHAEAVRLVRAGHLRVVR